MPNLSSLANATTVAQTIGNLVLVTPQSVVGYQPQNKSNPNGTPSAKQLPPSVLFHYEGEQSVILESEITDHYIEDNTTIQDNIALKPILVSTKGYIGELNNVLPDSLKALKIIADKLTIIGGFAPQLTTTGLIAYNAAFQAYQLAQNAINAAVSTWSSVAQISSGVNDSQAVVGSDGLTGFNPATGKINSLVQNKQQIAFQQWCGYWQSRTLFTVQTPWAVFQNMAIRRVVPLQDAETRVITEFTVDFKQIRTAQTITTRSGITQTFQGRLQSQASGLVDLGTSSPVPSIPLSSGLSTMGVA